MPQGVDSGHWTQDPRRLLSGRPSGRSGRSCAAGGGFLFLTAVNILCQPDGCGRWRKILDKLSYWSGMVWLSLTHRNHTYYGRVNDGVAS
jgi:hypothetical protein